MAKYAMKDDMCVPTTTKKIEEQFSAFLILCQHIFSIAAHNADIENDFSIKNVQWTKEQSKLDVNTEETMWQCNGNTVHDCQCTYLIRAAKASGNLIQEKYAIQMLISYFR